MVPSIARSAVIRKTQRDVNIITGNYEAAYAIGLLLHRMQAEPDAELIHSASIPKLHNYLNEQLKATGYEPKDPREKILIDMILDYKPSDQWDDDVLGMLEWGLRDNSPW